ncbi:uncharacterized protein B0I36DRAFT_373727 [Microdochium trichocladiopsis]|uniref:Microtubule associated protein n=1 Tax=Microdochium trichocladiopsis TaxID=1682393 RepID=A0A9P8Y9E5_9PEZI|nr:uncharacterized protein B0I36DRAFT_373727 [Microdochium trichocladiopsis]KAH7033527.1 hypothetical protein B0I36DRAFT_373727 [Microdochium trichocladiopsis]
MAVSPQPPRNAFVARVRKIYNPVGFTHGYNFILWFVFGGALLGFSLARLQYLDFYGTYCNPDRSQQSGALPGECFYFLRPFYSAAVILHLACILPAAMLTVLQFVPAIRHKLLIFHRINGYIILLLSLAGAVGGLMLARRTAGGAVDAQASIGVLGVAFVLALTAAYYNIKRMRIDLHRAWMLRAWAWAGSIITMRIILIILAIVLPTTDAYYSSQPCEKVAWQMNNPELVQAAYPECADYFNSTAGPQQQEQQQLHVSVLAAFRGARNSAQVMSAFDLSFGSAMWLALAIHAFGVELYLALTRSEAARLRKVSLERRGKKASSGPSTP